MNLTLQDRMSIEVFNIQTSINKFHLQIKIINNIIKQASRFLKVLAPGKPVSNKNRLKNFKSRVLSRRTMQTAIFKAAICTSA